MKVNINRQKLGWEDFTWGTGTVQQTRGGVVGTVTQLNAGLFPYDATRTLADIIAIVEADTAITNANVITTNADVLITNADVLITNADVVTTNADVLITNADVLLTNADVITVASIYDMFDDRMLGSKASDPLLDNDGNALLDGALYWNSTNNRMMVYPISTGIWEAALAISASSADTFTNKTIDSITNTVGADHAHYKVRNASGTTIPVGTVIAAMGTQPGTDYIQVVPVTNPQTQVAIGIVNTELANNGTGLCVGRGIYDDADTSAWVVGSILYPNTSGGLTTVKPTAGMYQACAYVMRQHSSSGTLLVNFIEPRTIASTTLAGEVVLNDTLTSTSITQALTAAQGKVLNDRLATVESGTVQEGDSVTLTGDVTGTAVFDANGNVSITTIVVDDSHNHIVANVDGLQTLLDGKVDKSVVVTTAVTSVTFNADGSITIVTP